MRRAISAAVFCLSTAVPASAEDCTKAVQAAFEKQRLSAGYRVQSKSPSDRGDIETTTLFVRPDKMHNKVVVPGEPGALETIAIGRWAWASHGMGFQELQPQFAQSITFDVDAALNRPSASTEPFACLGTVARDGKEFVAYRTEPKASPGAAVGPDNPALARTIFVDAATGLPALSIVSEPKTDAKSIVSAAYSYPADIKIEAPDAVPAGRTR